LGFELAEKKLFKKDQNFKNSPWRVLWRVPPESMEQDTPWRAMDAPWRAKAAKASFLKWKHLIGPEHNNSPWRVITRQGEFIFVQPYKYSLCLIF
jgi:hypothetical protein